MKTKRSVKRYTNERIRLIEEALKSMSWDLCIDEILKKLEIDKKKFRYMMMNRKRYKYAKRVIDAIAEHFPELVSIKVWVDDRDRKMFRMMYEKGIRFCEMGKILGLAANSLNNITLKDKKGVVGDELLHIKNRKEMVSKIKRKFSKKEFSNIKYRDLVYYGLGLWYNVNNRCFKKSKQLINYEMRIGKNHVARGKCTKHSFLITMREWFNNGEILYLIYLFKKYDIEMELMKEIEDYYLWKYSRFLSLVEIAYIEEKTKDSIWHIHLKKRK